MPDCLCQTPNLTSSSSLQLASKTVELQVYAHPWAHVVRKVMNVVDHSLLAGDLIGLDPCCRIAYCSACSHVLMTTLIFYCLAFALAYCVLCNHVWLQPFL